MEHDITSQILLPGVHDIDLLWLLQSTFNSASGSSDASQVTFSQPGEEWSLKLLYTESRSLRVLRGPALHDEQLSKLIEQVHAELLHPVSQIVSREIVLAQLPVRGALGLRPHFQIAPLPQEVISETPFLLGYSPFVLEYETPKTNFAWLRVGRQRRRFREIYLLLNLLMGPLKRMAQNVAFHWVLDPSAGIDNLRSRCLQEGVFIPGFSAQAEQYTDLQGFEPISEIRTEDFFGRRGFDRPMPLEMPEYTNRLALAYHELPRAQKERFLRACFWFEHSQVASVHAQSASFLALINSIEVLVDREHNTTHCETCGKSTGRSATQLFVDFLDQYAPMDEEYSNARRKLYRMRSALSHGWDLFMTDTEFNVFIHPDAWEELTQIEQTRTLTRLALLAWLAQHSG
jgi:hypothetical protein